MKLKNSQQRQDKITTENRIGENYANNIKDCYNMIWKEKQKST